MKQKIQYDDYKKKYFPIVIKSDDGDDIILSIPLRTKYPYLIFPSDNMEVQRMLSKKSLIYFYGFTTDDDIEVIYQFAHNDETSILFGRKVVEKYAMIVKQFITEHRNAIIKTQNSIFKKRANKILFYEFYKDQAKEENIKGGITYGTVDEY